MSVCVCVCVCNAARLVLLVHIGSILTRTENICMERKSIYIYIYIYTHKHTGSYTNYICLIQSNFMKCLSKKYTNIQTFYTYNTK